MQLSLTVNNKPVEMEVPDDLFLLEFLRETLGLTGTHQGCNTTQCGACTVHVDGKAVKACAMLAAECDGQQVLTVEGLDPQSPDSDLHPMQDAFRAQHGLQCGFCTSGFIMLGLDIARRHSAPSRDVIRTELKGNLCRCTGYHNIVSAIEHGTKAMNQTESSQ